MLIEYIRKGSKKSTEKYTPKRGVMVSYAVSGAEEGSTAGSVEKGKVVIGFSLCHSKYDRYDFIKKMHVPHHGFKIALERAETWEGLERFMIKGTPGSFPHHVVIPESIRKRVHKFITRTTQYYQDKQIPRWALEFKEYMDCLDQYRHKPVKGDGSVKTAKGVRWADKPINDEKSMREPDCCS
jgi:hypothetical protein